MGRGEGGRERTTTATTRERQERQEMRGRPSSISEKGNTHARTHTQQHIYAYTHTPAHSLRERNNDHTCAEEGGGGAPLEHRRKKRQRRRTRRQTSTHMRTPGYHARQQSNRTLREVPHPTPPHTPTQREHHGAQTETDRRTRNGEGPTTQTTPSRRIVSPAQDIRIDKGERLHRQVHNEQVDQHARKQGVEAGEGGRQKIVIGVTKTRR